MYQQAPNGPVSTPYCVTSFALALTKRLPFFEGEEPRHPVVGALSSGASPYTPHRLGTQMASHHPRSSVVTPEALEETHRNV